MVYKPLEGIVPVMSLTGYETTCSSFTSLPPLRSISLFEYAPSAIPAAGTALAPHITPRVGVITRHPEPPQHALPRADQQSDRESSQPITGAIYVGIRTARKTRPTEPQRNVA
ncbi:hypothetical protein I7I51_04144 [Histoplasma capsulatum]|uniref:Uncharacterized protein n=1 Tax=Ajellomyces capsulatus TaxID=5037 RepID=A0A8A1MCT5_AJECA|nr:predicted protein [Histoplasma mississippiense (nom. inval.)]EDN07920.1 predicted protein [Histoplasma mississippiense (nom. inval.)]QSS61967.1 hypothetical protein I7I51_04144 [Histoplasma capsulatum]